MTMNLTGLGVVLVTTSSETEAKKIASTLVELNLAACVNFWQVTSIYRWQGEVNSDNEWQLIIKTDLSNFAQLEAKITELHSYEVPEIIALPIIQGSQLYLSWLQNNVIHS